jgi:outer membrane protein TolC
LSVGCGLNAQGHREVSAALAEYERRARQTPVEYGDLSRIADARPPQKAPPERTSSKPDEHSLAGLIATALERNPEIQSAIDTTKSAASRVPQATALMDPILMTRTLPEPTRTADGDMVFVLGVSQTLPIPSKLERRGRIALSETRMALRELEQTRLRIIAEVKRAYFQLFAVDQAVLITRENQTLLRDLIEVARGQLVAGKRQQEDILRAQVEHSNLESQLVELAQRRETTVALINSMLDRPPRTNVDSIASYDVRRLRPHLNELLTQAYLRNPELVKIEHQVVRDEHRLELAKLDYIPDFTVGFEWMLMQPRDAFVPPIDPNTGMRPPFNRMSEEGTDSWAVTVALNIPVWFERIEAGIREARERLSASRRQHHAAKNKLTYQVEDALARINSQRDIADLYATAIIPQAEQAFQVSREGYITGTSDFQFVIDNWQKWLFFRLQYFRTIAEMEQSVADLEQAVGVSMIEVESPVTSTQVGEGG